MLKVVKERNVLVSEEMNEVLRDVISRHFEIQFLLGKQTEEIYSIFKLNDIVKYKIDIINVIFHKTAVSQRNFFEPKKQLNSLEEIVEKIKSIIEFELLSDYKKEKFVFDYDTLTKTISLLRKLEKKLESINRLAEKKLTKKELN